MYKAIREKKNSKTHNNSFVMNGTKIFMGSFGMVLDAC